MGFRLVPKSVTLNDLEQRKAIILRYFAEFGSFWGLLHKSGGRRYTDTFCELNVAQRI